MVVYIIIYLNYNKVMKKLILLCLIFPCISVFANEITEDYLDIATNYATFGQYGEAQNYISKILQIDSYNNEAKELKNTLLRIQNPTLESYLTTTNGKLKQAFLAKKDGNRNGMLYTLNSMPEDFWANYFLAEYYRDNNNPQSSVSYYKKAIELKPNYSQSYLGVAKAYIDTKDFQSAIDNLDKYISYNKNSDIAYAMRAEAKMNLNYILEAQEDINKALNIEENISYLLLKAKILYYKGDYDGAKNMFNLLSRNVQTSEVYKYMGLCDYGMNDYKNAMLNLDKAIILSDEDKSTISTYNNLKMMLDKR